MKTHTPIRIADTFCTGPVHELFNAGLLQALARRRDTEIEYFSGRSSARSVRKLLSGEEKVVYRSHFVPGGTGKHSLLARYAWGAVLNLFHLLTIPRGTLLVLNFNNPFSLGALDAVNRIVRKKVVVFCHGEMEALSEDYPRGGILSRIIRRRVRNFFLKPNRPVSRDIRYVAAGENILRNLTACLPSQFAVQFSAVDHPLPDAPYRSENKKKEKNRPFSIGVIGSFSAAKGWDDFIRIADHFQNDPSIRFTAVGTGRVALPERISRMSFRMGHHYMDRESYEKSIGELDCVLFLYPASGYRFTASGALMETLRLRKTVVGLRTDYFGYVFEKSAPWGRWVDSIPDLIRLIDQMKNGQGKQPWDFEGIERDWRKRTDSAIDRLLKHCG